MRRSRRYTGFRRRLAGFCAVLILISCLYIPAVSVETANAPKDYITHDGEAVSQVTLPQDGKLRLRIQAAAGSNASYSWQIRDPEAGAWINISGASNETLWVTYALVGSMLEADGTAQLRCRLREGDTYRETDPVKVTVSFAPQEQSSGTTIGNGTKVRMRSAARTGEDGELTTHSIIINYVFDNNALAFEPYGATVAHGSDFTHTIKSPEVVGYKPIRRVGDAYIDASQVALDLKNITQDVVINVVYEPALVKFSVHHHLQNLLDDDYSLSYDYITTGQAITGTMVPDGLAKTEQELPGFRALAYEKLTVAADGSTVVEIRYDRNYYLVDFDMNGGYGSEPVYTRYGSKVGANDPIRHGYVFGGWELVSYDGHTPTAQQAADYAISSGTTILVPAANLRYRAKWITQQTTYTMVFWKENADNDGYSYWCYLDKLPAMSGSYVDAQDWVDRVANITDDQYFTFNGQRSDKNVLVEGDGSTIINVYYTRNYYPITVQAPGKCTIPVKHAHTDECYDQICGKGHVHNSECIAQLVCRETEHKEHTAACIGCGIAEHIHGGIGCECTKVAHTHTTACWGSGVGDAESPWNAPKNPQNGQVYRSWNRTYYIYILGSWYTYKSSGASSGDIVDPQCRMDEHTHGQDCVCNQEEHVHNAGCYSDSLHTHTEDCYRYSCNLEEHTHTDACYRLKCAIPTNHSHSSNCNNSSRTNTVKIINRKYQQSLADIWPIVDDNGKIYNSGERWDPDGSNYFSNVLVYIAKMLPEPLTLKLSTSSADTFVMNYYLQVLPGQPFEVQKDGKQYIKSHTIVANYNYITYAEDFFEIKGFVRYDSDPDFRNNQIDIVGGGTVNFFYDRSTNNPLTFQNNGIVLDDKTVSKVMYEAPLKSYRFEPEYPTNLEPGAYTFGGWYTSPGCFNGTEVDWEKIVMDEGGLQLYAKWNPITHRVRVFKDATMTQQIGEDQTVDHKSFAYPPTGQVTNGNYVFHGWFYKDIVNGEEVEKAFVFNGIPIVKDMDIYAKWSSHVSVDYKINYVLKLTGEPIAEPTIGSAIAGHNETFQAKAGAELFPGYQTGYYPLTNSHTITMSVDGTHEFTFEYVYVESVPYKVRYVDALTGQDLREPKVVTDNTLSVVTETFVRIDEKMPDAYQKRLVLVADGEHRDENGVLDENVITFYYNTDLEHAYYRVVHYIQNMAGDNYREYRSEEAVGTIGTRYTIDALTLTGFHFDGSLTKVNGISAPVAGNSVSATLTSEGMLVELYYNRSVVDYTVRYLDREGNEIHTSKTGSGVFGLQVAEYALDLHYLGYERIGEEAKVLTLSANPEYNVLEFVYQERMVSLKYQIVGPAGCGSLSQTSENIMAINGSPIGSMPSAKKGFAFVGWFEDEACTRPVNSALVNSANNHLTPTKNGNVWQPMTYYAKFIALETDLTIRTLFADPQDAPQGFIFRIQGADAATAGVDLIVSIIGSGDATVTKLPVGKYTVTEVSGWAWRYDCANAQRELVLEYNENGTLLEFTHTREQVIWLDGNAVGTNVFQAGE